MASRELVCELCGVRRAETDVTVRRSSIHVTCHYCWECASACQRLLVPGLDFHSLLGAIVERAPKMITDPGTCPNCGEMLQESIELGMLGCAHCYERFRDELAPVILETQGRDKHIGKSPR